MPPLLSSAARQLPMRLAALSLVVVPVLACTSTDERPREASPAAGAVGAGATTSAVAELQAGLTVLLVERPYLVAATTDAVAAARGRLASPGVRAAVDALDANSVGMADVIGASYSTARRPLLAALRQEDRLLTQHAVALAATDKAGAARTRADLVTAQEQVAVVVRRVVPRLDAADVAAGLDADVDAQQAQSYDGVRAAAMEGAATARLLAAGIATDRELGSPSTEAARLRAELSGLLTEHVMLVGALAREVRTPGPGGASARVALRDNATALADLLARSYPAARSAFLRSWLAHLDRLDRYAVSRAKGVAARRAAVTAYPGELARLLETHVRRLPARTSQAELQPALETLLAAVDAAATGLPQAPTALRRAAAGQLPAAALVAAAIAEDLQLR